MSRSLLLVVCDFYYCYLSLGKEFDVPEDATIAEDGKIVSNAKNLEVSDGENFDDVVAELDYNQTLLENLSDDKNDL